MNLTWKESAPRSLRGMTAALTAAAVTTMSLGAFAQGEPPPPPAEEPLPPAPAPPEAEPAYDQGRPPPPGYDDRRGPPPPGYGPGYGPPPDPYNYGVPPGTPRGYAIDDWEEGDPVPPGYQPDSRIRKGLVIGGSVTMGSLWLLSVVFGAALVSIEETDETLERASGQGSDGTDPEDYYPLFVPVAGPFITIATAQSEGIGTAFLLIDGIAQAGGLAMLIAGIAAQEDYLRPVPQYGEIDVNFSPIVAPGFAGMGLNGSF